MKKAKTFIIPMLALAVFGMTACGGGEQSSSSQQQSSSSGKASIPVDTIASVEITNKAKLQADWPLNEGSRALEIKVLDTSGKQLSETVLIATGELKISSSDDSIVTTMGAGIYAKKGGKATITVKIQDKTDSVEVNVVEPKQAQTVAATLQQVANLADGQTAEGTFLTKGVVKAVTSAWDASYGNISFKIQDAGVDNELLCYRVVPAEGIDGSAIKAGDEVTINGKIKKYNGTLEYDAGAVIEAWKDGGIVVQTKTKINEVAAGDKVDLTGRVEAKSKRSAILNDGTGHIFIYGTADAIGAITIGKSYNVKGSTAEKNGAVQVESPVFTEVADVNLAADADTALTVAIADGWKAAGAKFGAADIKLYSWEGVIGKSGSYLTYGIPGSTTNIQAGYAPDEFAGLTEGAHYNIKAYFAGYSGGHSDASQDYANIVIVSATIPAGAVVVQSSPAIIPVGEKGYVTASTDGLAADTYTFTSSNPEVATVDPASGEVIGVANGTVEITVKSNTDVTKSAVATIDIVTIGKVDDAYAAGKALEVTPSADSDQSKMTEEKYFAQGVVKAITSDYYAPKRQMTLTMACETGSGEMTAYNIVVDDSIEYPPCVGDTIVIGGKVTKFIKKGKTEADAQIPWTGTSGAKIYSIAERATSTISEGAHDHATISGLAAEAKNGDVVEFEVSPEEGYQVIGVKANGVSATKGEGNKYSFTITANTTITVQAIPEGMEYICYDFASATYKGKWADGTKNEWTDRGDFWTCNASNTSNYVFLASKTNKASASLSNKTAVPGKITHISFTTTTGASASAVYLASVGTEEIKAHVTDQTHKLTGKGTLEWDVDVDSACNFFAITCNTTGYNGQISKAEVIYVPNAA